MEWGFLFGAGAEIDYGLPTGGKFALDIFRQDILESKNEFIAMRTAIDSVSEYVNEWLPENYKERNIGTFGKTILENIIKDTIDHKRNIIIKNLNNFDKYGKMVANDSKLENINKILEEKAQKNLRNCKLVAEVSFNDALKDGDNIFKSSYFSALLLVYKNKEISEDTKKELGKIIISILQLQIGALGATLTKNINDNLFKKKDEDIDLFDDIGEVLKLNYQSTGITGIEYLYDNKKIKINKEEDKIIYFAQSILEEIFSSVLDYKSLIDTNWHYLYCPKSEWSKFCKISIFLLTVKNYMLKIFESVNTSNLGYYDELKECLIENKIKISKIATTNYNTLISEKINFKEEIVHLNGAVDQWYDPYLNKIGTKDNLNKNGNKFLVPLLFTQSGTKPMTSIYKTLEYAKLYESWKESDKIIIVGFAFNLDDEHINGIIRTLVDDDKKEIIVIGKENEKEDIVKKLKVNNEDNIFIVNIDNERCINGEKWFKYILDNNYYLSNNS